MSTATKFWVVINTAYVMVTIKKYDTEAKARECAAALAVCQPGHRYAVLESIAVCVKNRTDWTELPRET